MKKYPLWHHAREQSFQSIKNTQSAQDPTVWRRKRLCAREETSQEYLQVSKPAHTYHGKKFLLKKGIPNKTNLKKNQPKKIGESTAGQ